MKIEFYAKSNPKETIQQHTDKLLKNYKILNELYYKVPINWNLLKDACIYHDLGKINSKFQNKILYGKRNENEVAHNLLSLAFINTKLLKEKYSEDDIKILAHAVAYHHERGNYDKELYEEELKDIKENSKEFKYDKLEITRIKEIPAKYFSKDRIYDDNENFYNYVLIKGLLNRLDYAASGEIEVEQKNDFLRESLSNLMLSWKNLNPKSHWNELQNFMINNKEKNTIVIAQTGMGKTEAGLLWIDNNKGFFILPLKSAINEIYKRITGNIVFKNKVGLLHSDTFSKYIEYEKEEIDIQKYYNETKQLSLALTVCTLDQIFDFVYRYRDFELKLATLSYSKIVIDEIQMYSSNLVAYIIVGLKMINEVGGKFSILTATFPKFIGDLLKKYNVNFVESEKPFINNQIRHKVKVLEEDLNVKRILENYKENKILIVCNTVKKAQSIYNELVKNKDIEKQRVNLLHSKFIRKDRNEKEIKIMELGDKDNKDFGIWIGTQVVEASLDIDFDLLFTELSDINGFFQRLGRCYRKREFKEEGYNCYLYVGKEKPCSGIRNNERSIIDYDIFKASKEILLKEKIDGSLSEQKKLDLIDRIYSTENIKDTKYYEKVIEGIRYLNTIDAYELDKKEVRKRFRDINSLLVIPLPVYEREYKIIKKLEEEINAKKPSTKENKIEKSKKIELLKAYTLNISYGEANKRIKDEETINLGKFEKIYILDCDYDIDLGIVLKKIENNNLDFDSLLI
ncbi:MAG: CRISPR-associated helicase Cas3' [Fusobacterium sp. JB021]|nr:CRISPR-associated helicase Cas3' [Fusobacterium sp. JB021]